MPNEPSRREVVTTLSMAAAAGLIAVPARPAHARSVKWSAGTGAPKLEAPADATASRRRSSPSRRAPSIRARSTSTRASACSWPSTISRWT